MSMEVFWKVWYVVGSLIRERLLKKNVKNFNNLVLN